MILEKVHKKRVEKIKRVKPPVGFLFASWLLTSLLDKFGWKLMRIVVFFH